MLRPPVWCQAGPIYGLSSQRFLHVLFRSLQVNSEAVAPPHFKSLSYIIPSSVSILITCAVEFNDPRIDSVSVTPVMFIYKFDVIIIQIFVDTQQSNETQ
jgi:hypothetical protein